jgi:hypothetical protein
MEALERNNSKRFEALAQQQTDIYHKFSSKSIHFETIGRTLWADSQSASFALGETSFFLRLTPRGGYNCYSALRTIAAWLVAQKRETGALPVWTAQQLS